MQQQQRTYFARARLFEVIQRVREVNNERKRAAGWRMTGKSYHDPDLKAHPDHELDYIAAPPRMAHYMEVSTKVYQTYLKYIAPEDIHVYSIDEVFMDVTAYLGSYKMTAHALAMKMIRDVLATTGITATAGIGSNIRRTALPSLCQEAFRQECHPPRPELRGRSHSQGP